VSAIENVPHYLEKLRAALDALPGDRLTRLGEMLYRAYRNERQVFTLGNGGSAATASHIAADLAKNTIGPNMRRFRVLSLNDNTPMLTALANDVGYEKVFSEQLKSLVRMGDLLIVLSTSGNSPSVLSAMRCAREHSAEVAAILGFDGGEAAGLADLALVVRSDHCGVVEDVHLVINHIMVDYFKSKLMDEEPWLVA
jgi:D-sedoheptulose 7-phosphate isomerase